MPQIIPAAEPFFFPGKSGSSVGCLLVHGFTGTPKEMRWMGEYLAQQGYSALGVRLTGHATRPKDMIRSRWQDWLLSLEDGYHFLHSFTKHIYVLGLSMGGNLALVFAAQFPIAGVIAMSTPYKLPDDPRLGFAKQISLIYPFLPKDDSDQNEGWFDKEIARQHIAYPAHPVRSIAELNQLMVLMRAILPKVKVPVLLIHSRDDDYVITNSMENIYTALGSQDKQMMWVEGSGHVVTEEPQREKVFEATRDFIVRIEAARES